MFGIDKKWILLAVVIIAVGGWFAWDHSTKAPAEVPAVEKTN